VSPEAAATKAGRASRKSWLSWITAALVYLLAVFHRTSFGVAGLQAADRFGIGVAALSAFTVLQVAVYAAMQIPAGLLVDRYGSRRVLTFALFFLGLGQVLMAIVHSYPLALLARMLTGFGDALTFVSVLRLIAAHFPGRQYPVVTSFTTALGYVGNLAATVPLTLLLAGPGWTATFLAVGLGTAAYTVVVYLRVRDTPDDGAAPEARAKERVRPRELGRQVAQAWRTPGTRLGYWVHFSTMFGPNVLTLLWGVPYLVRDQHLPTASASALLTVFVFGSMFGGPLVGSVIGARPALRMTLVVGYLAAATVIWTVLICWPGTIPRHVLVPIFALLSLGGPASMIGFALARDYNPMDRVGTATGVVNMGGFVATTIAAFTFGVLLQWTGNFRIALLSILALLVLASLRVAVWWRRTRAALLAAQDRGERVPVRIRRRRWDVESSDAHPVPA
jgi:sugar phosphate permease